jgi:4-amino-4-deoxychorismate lyase
MSRLFETIKIVNRIPQNITYHNRRMNAARLELFQRNDMIDIAAVIIPPKNLDNGLFRCKVVYSETIESVEFAPYTRRKINSLKLIESETIDYRYKYLDRSALELLLIMAGNDDIIIVKHGMITDTSYSNLTFFDGKRWITPSTPLLAGTARARLLEHEQIIEREIHPDDIGKFEKAALINAMNDLDEAPIVEIQNINW